VIAGVTGARAITTVRSKRSILILLAALIVLVALGHALLLPLIVQRVAISRLRDLGFHNVRVDVDSVRPWRLGLRNLAMGHHDNLCAATVAVAGDQTLLLGGTIDTVELADVLFKVRLRDGRFDWSDLWQETPTTKVPFERLVVHSGTIEVDYGGPPMQLPLLRGHVLHEGNGRMVIDLEAQLMNMPLPIKGWFDVYTGKGKIETTGLLDLIQWFKPSF